MFERKAVELKIYIKFLASFIIAFTVIMLLFFGAYKGTINVIKQDKVRETLFSMQRACTIIDEEIKNANTRIFNLSREMPIKELFSRNAPLMPADFVLLIAAYNMMKRYELSGGIVIDCIFFADNQNAVMLNERHIVTDVKYYYNNNLFDYSGVSYEDWREKVFRDSGDQKYVGVFWQNALADFGEKESKEVITYIKKISLPKAESGLVSILILDTQKMLEMVSPFVSDQNSWIYVEDNNGNMLFSDNYDGQPLPEVSGTSGYTDATPGYLKSTVLYATSPEFGLTYYVSIPLSWVETQVFPFMSMFKFFMCFSLILSIILSVMLAYYNGKPIQQLVKSISKRFSGCVSSGPYDYIEKSFDDLYGRNTVMSEKLNAWSDIVKVGLMEHLLKGNKTTTYETEALHDLLGPFPLFFRVLLINCLVYDKKKNFYDMQNIILAVSSYIYNNMHTYIVYPLDNKNIAVVVDTSNMKNGEADFDVFAESLLSDLNVAFDGENDLLFSIGIGSQYDSMQLANISCFEARRVLASVKYWTNERIVWYERFNKKESGYEFPMEHMEKLKNYILAGDDKSCGLLLTQIYENRFDGKAFLSDDVTQLYYDLKGIILRIAGSELPIDDIARDIPGYDTSCMPADIISGFAGIFHKICEYAKSQKSEVHGRLLEMIISYINENFRKPYLSLKSLSIEFNMSEKYISLLFKEKTRCGFSDYVENLRLAEVARQMSQTNIRISDIFESVGYTSRNTFYKAFRRRFGICPSMWRTQNASHHEVLNNSKL